MDVAEIGLNLIMAICVVGVAVCVGVLIGFAIEGARR